MSIAVLRTYIAKCKEEHDAYLSKKGRLENKVPEEKNSGSVAKNNSITQDAEANGDTDVQQDQSLDETESNSEGFIRMPSWKGSQELKAPRVLEVSFFFLYE